MKETKTFTLWNFIVVSTNFLWQKSDFGEEKQGRIYCWSHSITFKIDLSISHLMGRCIKVFSFISRDFKHKHLGQAGLY